VILVVDLMSIVGQAASILCVIHTAGI